MKNLIFGFCLCISSSLICAQTRISYPESYDSFANPERGFQKYSITNAQYNNTVNYSNLSQSTLRGWRNGNDKVSVIFRYFLLNNFLYSNISQTYLDNMQKDFNVIRSAGLKCIVRFSYSNSRSSSAQQPEKSRIIAHIKQLKKLLEKNKDIIYTYQAGFIGTWGEWYYTNSSEFGTEDYINAAQWANRKEIIDAMLNTTPPEIPIQVRYPKIKKIMYGTTQLTASTAYQNTPRARIGFFNDAFLNAWGDMGTYSNVGQWEYPAGSEDYLYVSNETKYTPMSGETNGMNPPRSNIDNAITEMDATNWSTLNRDYHEEVISNWMDNPNRFSEMKRQLGYRFVLKKGSFSLNQNTLSVSLSIENVGFARLFKPRKAVLVLLNTNDNKRYTFILNTDPRTWEGKVNISQNINISALPTGNYSVHLQLPDINPGLAKRPEYSIRFANTNIWDNTQGYNNLRYTFNKTPVLDCPSVDIVVDGDDSEWSPVSVFSQKNGETLKVYNNSEYVYFQFNGNNFVNYQIYIDTKNGISGYSNYNWPELSANFMIENSRLYRYTGTGATWDWSQIEEGNIASVKNNGVVEVRMDINLFQNNSFKIGFKTLNSSWQTIRALPDRNENTEYLFCPTNRNNNGLSQVKVMSGLPSSPGKDEVLIFPNPVGNRLNISYKGADTPLDAAIFSIEGRLLKSENYDKVNTYTGSIDISSLPAGIYLLKINTKEKTKTVRFQKRL